MLTFATYAAFPDSLDLVDITIAAASGGSLTANTYYFWVQLHNWSGRNLQTSLGSVTVTNGQKIVITLKTTLRRSGEDFNFVVISANSSNTASSAVQIARWENKEESIHPDNSRIALSSNTLTSFIGDQTIEITTNSQLTFSLPSLTVANFASLPASMLNGAVRYSTADAKYYRYKANTNQWVEQLSYGLYPYISDSKLEGGCNRKLSILANTIPTELKTNIDSVTQRFWFINGYEQDNYGEISANNNISLVITVNGSVVNNNNDSYASLFSGLIKTRFLGFYDFSDRTLNTALAGVGDTLTWEWSNSTLKLPTDLPRGQAAVYEIYYSFGTDDLIYLIPNGSTISLNIYNFGIKAQKTDLSYFTGDFIVKDYDRLRLVPDSLGIIRLDGVSIIKNYSSNYTSEDNYSLNLALDTDNQIAAISAAKVNEIRFIQDENDLETTEAIRAYIGTVAGESAVSGASNSLTVSPNARITVTIDLPSDGTNATIRSNYPDIAIASNNKAILNAPKLNAYISNGSTVYKHSNVINCGNADSLTIILSTLGSEVFTLPSAPASDYCLFDFPNNPVISESVGLGSIPAGTYQIYLSYSYPAPNPYVTRIRHDLAGCIVESAYELIEINNFLVAWNQPTTNSDIVFQSNQYQGIKYNLVATTNPGVSNDITQGYGVKSFWLNTNTDTFFICADATTNNAVWVQIKDNFLSNIIEDTTPQLGGQLDVNGHALGDGTNELLTFTEVGSAVNNVNLKNNSTGNNPEISVVGNDSNISLDIATKGTGIININAPIYFAKPQDYIVINLGSGSAIDLSLGNIFKRNPIAGNVTFSLSNVTSEYHLFTLYFEYTSGTITWFNNLLWDGNTEPLWTTTKLYELGFKSYDGGSNWLGFLIWSNN